MDARYASMVRRVGKGFYRRYIYAVREAVHDVLIGSLISRVTVKRQVYFPVAAPNLFSSLEINRLPVSS